MNEECYNVYVGVYKNHISFIFNDRLDAHLVETVQLLCLFSFLFTYLLIAYHQVYNINVTYKYFIIY